MADFIDLTWIETIEQLNGFMAVQKEHMTGLNQGKIKISEKLENILKSQMDIFYNGIKKVYDWEIYEEDKDWCLKNNRINEPDCEKCSHGKIFFDKTVKKMLDLIIKDFSVLEDVENTYVLREVKEIIKKRSGLYGN